MKTGTFDYSLRPRCALVDAVALLSDITRQGELHPLIVKVTALATEPGALQSYAIKDKLAYGPIRFGITYYADVLSISDDEIVTVARQAPKTKVRNVVRLRDEGDGTVQIDVTITLSAPTLLHGYAIREGRAAHLKLAERMAAVLEARA